MGKKILIIDDDNDIITLLYDTLEGEDYKVEFAVNGQKGIDRIPVLTRK